MATYPAEVLIDNPAVYYRLDMTGLANNGDTIPDSSVDVLNGSLVFAPADTGFGAAQEPYGWPSPIETDPDSKEFLGQTLFFTQARIVRATNALIEPAGDFALEAWLRPFEFTSFDPQDWCGKKNTCYLETFNFGTTFAGACYDSAGTLWTAHDTSINAVFGQSYHVVLVRTSNVLSLYINGALKANTT